MISTTKLGPYRWQSAIVVQDKYAANVSRHIVLVSCSLGSPALREPLGGTQKRTAVPFKCRPVAELDMPLFVGDLVCLCNALRRFFAWIHNLAFPIPKPERPAQRAVPRPIIYPFLPAETWAAIAAHLYDPADLSALSQICRALRLTGQARLFSRVDLLDMRDLGNVMTTLQRDAIAQGPLGHYVRRLRVVLDPEGTLEPPNLSESAEALRIILVHCTNLRVLSLPHWTRRFSLTGGELGMQWPLLRSLEVRVDDDHGIDGPWFMPLLRASPGLRELRIWGTCALPSGVVERLEAFTGDLPSAAAIIPGRPVRSIHLVGAVDVDHVAFQLHVDSADEDPILELLLRPMSHQPNEYLSVLRDGFPSLRKLTLLGVPRHFIDEVIRGASELPKWPSLRELVLNCDDEEGIEVDEPALVHCLRRDHPQLQSVRLRSAFSYDLCLKDFMRSSD